MTAGPDAVRSGLGSRRIAALADRPLGELIPLVKAEKLAAQALADVFLRRARGRDAVVGAFVDQDAAAVLGEAAANDALRRDARRGRIFGIPVAVDEVLDVAYRRCTRGSAYYAGRVADHDAAIVRALREAGGIVLGTTATSELALVGHGPVCNPHDPARSAGGASGGAAAAVAAGFAPAAVSVESGGAMLRAAAYCGVVGYRATRGTVATDDAGVPVRFCAALGIFARRVADACCLAGALLADRAVRSGLAATGAAGTTVWLIENPLEPLVAEECRAARATAVEALAAAGLRVERLRLPDWAMDAVGILEVVANYELAQRFGAVRDGPADAASDVLRARIDRGRWMSAGEYENARREVRRLGQRLLSQFGARSVLLDVATLDPAPLRTDRPGSTAVLAPWALAGAPAVVVPAGTADGLPTAVQLIGRPGGDASLLAVAAILSQPTR